MKLYLCNTLYQIVVAIQISLTINKDQKNILVINETVSNAERIVFNLKKIDRFQYSFVLKTRNTDWKEILGQSLLERKYNRILENQFESKEIISEIDEYYFANIAGLSLLLGMFLKKKTKHIGFSIYEDGVSAYSTIYEDAIQYRLENSNILKRFYYNIFPSIVGTAKKYYVFSPELMVWKCPFDVEQIPAINYHDEKLRHILNIIFDYEQFQDKYNEKVIFFEESYFADNINTNDISIVEQLADRYGKENIFVKIHPRNPDNRFASLGYKTNLNQSVPWEVIALNMDLDSKILVSMTSTAVVNSFLMFHSKAKMIMEYKHLEINNYRIEKTIEVIEKIKDIYPTVFSELD